MSTYDQMKETAVLSGANAPFVENLFERYLEDPNTVPENWKSYFEKIVSESDATNVPRLAIEEKFKILAKAQKMAASSSTGSNSKQAAVGALIAAYRNSGHRAASTDPLSLHPHGVADVVDLDPAYHGLTESDMEESFNVETLYAGLQEMKLKDIIIFLKSVYTSTIGIEVNHLSDIEEKRWIQERFEQFAKKPKANAEQKQEILEDLIKGEGLEHYLHTRYVGQKRFSLEGGESLIPMMDRLIQRIGANGGKEVVIGMAHRGRLNVLINILGKYPKDLFDEFEGKSIQLDTDKAGDVKYHMGFSSDVGTPGGDVHLTLAFNPSHLEIVNPVVQGSVRARMARRSKGKTIDSVMDVANECVPIQIHGDAAFANQGVIQETLQLSQVRGYRVGGTVHVIINNQIGFTTSNLQDIRSSTYCSDPAKIIQAPVLHVNGDDPEAVAVVAEIASDFVFKYQRDIVIDMVCYRRLGHNEADEPAATQPLMYKNIRARKTTLGLYADKLVGEGVLTAEKLEELKGIYNSKLEAGECVARPIQTAPDDLLSEAWRKLSNVDWELAVDTSMDKKELVRLATKIYTIPEGFHAHRIVQKLMNTRLKMAQEDKPFDWGFAENLAYASLLDEGYQVRLSGEDSGRGTFAHRHAVIHDTENGKSHLIFSEVKENQPITRVIDSILSEEAVLGFEYGYSTTEPHGLTIWEAQFGDFANGAQVLIDQFISSGESKWGRYCGLALMLPHGYEGQGPEHSSARLERYLQLCANHNMRVCVPTTPAQTFHMLRRQMHQPFRKPLIIMTPKSLLRHKLAVSTMDDLASGHFHTVIPEIDKLDAAAVDRVVFCSGKVYYDLLEMRREQKIEDVAIIRVEELYPFPEKEFKKQLGLYPNLKEIIWCQEEPENQGAWRNITHRLHQANDTKASIAYVGRAESASTAAGYASVHKSEQETLVKAALRVSK